MQEQLAAHVKALPEPFRATVLLRYFEGVSAAEIARRDRVPAGTVRWRLKRALDLLRERLDAEHDGDRRAWALALLPIAVASDQSFGHGSGVGLVAAAVQGVVAMGIGAKVVMGSVAGLGALLLLAVSVNAVIPFGDTESEPSAPVEVSFRAAPDAPAERRRVESIDVAAETHWSPPYGVTVDSAPAAAPAVIEGRALDEHGTAIAGVRVRGQMGTETFTSDDGTFVLSVGIPDFSRSLYVRLTAGGHATVEIDIPVFCGETSYAGDVEMVTAGAIAGRVVGADGRPIAGAWIGLATAFQAGAPYTRRRRMRHAAMHRRDTVRTDASGAFTLRGVPAGTQRLCTGGDEYLSTLSGLIEVRAAVESYGVELVLDKLRREDVISGRVVAPDGSPLSDAELRYEYDVGWSGSGNGTMSVARDGTFRLILTHDAPHSFMATDREGRWGGVSIPDVAPGTRDLELRLPENRYFDVVVVDRAGRLVAAYQVATNDRARGVLFDRLVAQDPKGHTRVRVPAQDFHIEIEAAGFDTGRAGPFSPGAVPETVQVTLTALPGVRGTVTTTGGPLAGATVGAYAVADGPIYFLNGFMTSRQPSPEAEVLTEADGTYALTVRESGTYLVRVESPGLAPFESPPFEYDPTVGRNAVDAALSAGGAILGVVTDDAGRALAGTVVGASRGDSHAVSQRVGPDGRFHFEHLTPGRWEVRRIEKDLVIGTSMFTTSSGAFKVDWTCDVRDGETTLFDLGPPRATNVVLKARIRVDGAGAAGWSLTTLSQVSSKLRLGLANALIGYEGDVEVATLHASDYRVMVRSPRSRLVFFRDVSLQSGENAIGLDLNLGSASISGLSPGIADEPRLDLAYVWFGDDGWFVFAPLIPDENGVAELPEVPAGVAHIRRFDPVAADSDPAEWPIVKALTVPAGGSVELSLETDLSTDTE